MLVHRTFKHGRGIKLKSAFFSVIIPEFAESCGVIDFLQRAGNNTDISPDTLVFAVQLVEKLVSKLELPGIHLDTMSVLIETVALRTSVDNLSVFCALFTTLKTILQCPCIKEFCLNIDFQGKFSV